VPPISRSRAQPGAAPPASAWLSGSGTALPPVRRLRSQRADERSTKKQWARRTYWQLAGLALGVPATSPIPCGSRPARPREVLDLRRRHVAMLLAAASLAEVEQGSWFVDLNPHNRAFVAHLPKPLAQRTTQGYGRRIWGDQTLARLSDSDPESLALTWAASTYPIPAPRPRTEISPPEWNPRALALMNLVISVKGPPRRYALPLR